MKKKKFDKLVIKKLTQKLIKHRLSFKFSFGYQEFKMTAYGFINHKMISFTSNNKDFITCMGGLYLMILKEEDLYLKRRYGDEYEEERSNW